MAIETRSDKLLRLIDEIVQDRGLQLVDAECTSSSGQRFFLIQPSDSVYTLLVLVIESTSRMTCVEFRNPGDRALLSTQSADSGIREVRVYWDGAFKERENVLDVLSESLDALTLDTIAAIKPSRRQTCP